MILHLQRKIVLLAALALSLVWAVSHFSRAPDDPDWIVRLTLGMVLSFALLVSAPPRVRRHHPGWFDRNPRWLPALAAGAALLSVLGLVLPVRQFEWLGLVLLMYAAVRWAVPLRFRGNAARAFFLFYWIHPLPGQVFAPLQMWMQRLSVTGAEWVLHIFNHRVWADGFLLRLGTAEFGVPEECSGMRTAVTVLLCTLGVGMLLRMRWRRTLAFLALGLVQVLLLNILRISVIVHISVRSAQTISDAILHDTAGIFLLIAIALVNIEMVWWQSFIGKRRRIARAVAAEHAEPPKRSSFLPPFWRFLVRSALWGTLLLVMAAAVALAAYKRRPAHRAAMIKGAAEILLREQPQAARRAALAALALTPGDRGLWTLKLQALVRGEQYGEALRIVETLPRPLSYLEQAMQSAALAAHGHMDEAAAILTALPEDVQHWPVLAVFRAEYAMQVDDPDTVAEYVRYAVRSHVAVPRVRALYPYLAARGRWSAIAATHHAAPYTEIAHALLAIHANMVLNRPETAGRILRQTAAHYPDDIRLLNNLAQFAVRAPDSEWEKTYEKTLRAKLDDLDEDRLTLLIGHGFGMRRPDLAWLVWQRLEEIDPDDPALFLAAARHAGDWFVFRRRQIGLSAIDALQTEDMRDEYRRRRNEPGFAPYWQRIPLAEEMTAAPVEEIRMRYLQRALEELERRENADGLTQRLEQMFPIVLGLLGRTEEAHRRLDMLAEAYPETITEVLLQHALNYERRAEWQSSYEVLRSYFAAVEFADLRARLMMVNALLNSGLGQLAVQYARAAADAFTDAPEAQIALAAAWEAFGDREQALFILTRMPRAMQSPLYPQLLLEAGRQHEARRLALARGIRLREERADKHAARVLPAETSVVFRPPPLPDGQRATLAENAARLAAKADSPFIAALRRLEAVWLANNGADGAPLRKWEAAGRDSRERVAALYRLAVLNMQHGKIAPARAAVARGLEIMPDDVAMWRLRVLLSEGDPEIVAAARSIFPDDPEFWLADLVLRLRTAAAAGGLSDAALRNRLQQELEDAVAARRFPAGTMVRAADLLLRHDLVEPAAVAARHAIAAGQGLETAYVVGLRCALRMGDVKWALSCALGGADHARDPKPFYQMLVNINFARGALDRDLVVALDYLKTQFPAESIWAETLGFVHFLQGDPGRALNLLGPIIRRDDLRDVQVATLLMAAEAARLEGRNAHAAAILEAALEAYPGNQPLLNNLVYTLAQQPATRARAVALLPELVRGADDISEVLDTIAYVYIANGQLDQADAYLQRALDTIPADAYAYPFVRMTHAELLTARGEPDAGLEIMRAMVANPDYAAPVREEIGRRMEPIGRASVAQKMQKAHELAERGEIEPARNFVGEVLRSPYSTDAVIRDARQLRSRLGP